MQVLLPQHRVPNRNLLVRPQISHDSPVTILAGGRIVLDSGALCALWEAKLQDLFNFSESWLIQLCTPGGERGVAPAKHPQKTGNSLTLQEQTVIRESSGTMQLSDEMRHDRVQLDSQRHSRKCCNLYNYAGFHTFTSVVRIVIVYWPSINDGLLVQHLRLRSAGLLLYYSTTRNDMAVHIDLLHEFSGPRYIQNRHRRTRGLILAPSWEFA
jgi:hypothetical protein